MDPDALKEDEDNDVKDVEGDRSTFTRPILRVPIVKAQSHADEHSLMLKRPRTALTANNHLEDLNDE